MTKGIALRYRLFGPTGLRVSDAWLGTMTFGREWKWGAPAAECRKMFDAYAEAGGNVLDTADKYTDGQSESILGEPGAFLYKDATVTMQVEWQPLSVGLFGGVGMNLARMTGPGRASEMRVEYPEPEQASRLPSGVNATAVSWLAMYIWLPANAMARRRPVAWALLRFGPASRTGRTSPRLARGAPGRHSRPSFRRQYRFR